MDAIKTLAKTLRGARQSLTMPRRAVFLALQNQEPLTMHELVERCRGIDRASVYRSVALFERLGIVQRLQTGWKYKLELSDSFHEHHHHATCARCGLVIPLPENPKLEAYLHRLADAYRFALQNHQLELSGLCQQCQAQSSR